MTPETFKELLEQYRAGTLKGAARQVLLDLLYLPEKRDELEQLFAADFSLPDSPGAVDPETLELIYQHIRLTITREPPVRRLSIRWRYIAAAAVAGVVALTGLWWRAQRNKAPDKAVAETYYKNEVKPGGNHAVLTLANGTHIVLDSTGKWSMGIQGGCRVTKVSAGSLSYKATANDPSAVFYNTLATPAGGQYRVVLADGTKVWLNALSTLRFPTAFNGSARTVELTGEAYFEVAKNRDKPFHVTAHGVDVQVLGTDFDVNAYTDEAVIKTTLLEGAVKLVKANANILLKPGEQGQTSDAPGFILVAHADVDQAVAWKNGYFSFEGADVHTVMRQIARWYNVQVRYDGAPTKALFDGEIGRDLNLTQVLMGLSKTKVHFHLEGKILTVLP
jgi:ferric-dicitrate binding protein FerR (iron transport regulator)